MYRPGTLNDSNIISAVYSRFSGVFNGGSVCAKSRNVSRVNKQKKALDEIGNIIAVVLTGRNKEEQIRELID